MDTKLKPGFLLNAARASAMTMLRGALVICGFSLLVLLLNYKYVYNWIAGPFPLTADLVESVQRREFAEVTGALIPTAFEERTTTTVRLFHRAMEHSSTAVTASYFLFAIEG